MNVNVYLEGEEIYTSITVVSVAPEQEQYITVNYPEFRRDGEYVYRVTMNLAESTLWASKGYEIAFGEARIQRILNEEVAIECKDSISEQESIEVNDDRHGQVATEVAMKLKDQNVTKDRLRFVRGDGNIGFYLNDIAILFSTTEGGIISLKKGSKEFVDRAAKPIYYRATTDNDRGNNNGFLTSQWGLASKYQKLTNFSVEQIEDSYQLNYTFVTPTNPSTTSQVTYTVNQDCSIQVKMHYYGQKGLPMLPLYGMEFRMKSELECFSVYGLGPDENYIDRAAGAKLGRYHLRVADNLSRYVVPQECGNRTGVRSAQIYNESGEGIEITMIKDAFELNVLHYSTADLENALHIEDLPPIRNTFIRVAAKQMGVGGDDSWGAPVHPEYFISGEKDIEFEFKLSVIK
jgi:beta-galactosidase